jgi:hypothetical protein
MHDDVTEEVIGPRKTRFWGPWWDEHTCAEVDFGQMQYFIRVQAGDTPVDHWRSYSWSLRRIGTGWEILRSHDEWLEIVEDLKNRRIPLTAALVANGTRGAPAEAVEMFKQELQSLQRELRELEIAGPGWRPLDDDEQSVLEALYQRDQQTP